MTGQNDVDLISHFYTAPYITVAVFRLVTTLQLSVAHG